MENKLNKWFDAARHNPPMISSQEVGAMISNPRAAKSGLSTLKKTIFMGTTLFTIFSWLYWMNSTVSVDSGMQPEQKNQTRIPTVELSETPAVSKRLTKRPVVISETKANAGEKENVEETKKENNIGGGELSGYYPSGTTNPFYKQTGSGYDNIQLTNAELAGLGIITDGNTLRYLTQSDTTVYHFDFKRKPTVFAFSIKVTASGGVSSNNIHEQDEELKRLSSSAVPVVISMNEISGDGKENRERLMIAEQNTIPYGYRTEYISIVKADLVPVTVVTKGNASDDSQDNEIIFWYKNNEQFWQRLPDWARLKVQTDYPVFNEEKHRKLINELKEKDKQAEVSYPITATEIEASRSRTIDLTPVELQKLNILFNGKKLTYQLMSKRPDSSFVIIDLLVTPDMFSLNIRDKSGTPVQYKWNENYAWYITDTDLSITQNFVDPIVSDAQEDERANDMERLFKTRLPEMVPVRVRFDAKAVKKAKYKHPQTVLLFWFPETEAFIKALPERIQKQLGVNISSLNHHQTTPLKYIELNDEQLGKLGIKRNTESITVPMHTGNGKYLLSDYSSKGTVFHFNSMPPTNGALKSPAGGIKFNMNQGGSVGMDPTRQEPIKLPYPSPSLITEGNGLHWLTYQTDEEMSKEEQEYMIQHGLSPLEYKPMVEARRKGEAKLAAALNTYIALKVKSNEKPSGEPGRNPDLIIWYKPDSLLFATLPNDLSAQIQQELNRLNLKQSESGCQFFEACQSVRGSIGECVVYPNPTTGPMQIKMELLEARKVTVFITDISGKRVKDILSDETREKGVFNPQISLDGLAEGMYLLHVTTNKGEYIVQRVVKKG